MDDDWGFSSWSAPFWSFYHIVKNVRVQRYPVQTEFNWMHTESTKWNKCTTVSVAGTSHGTPYLRKKKLCISWTIATARCLFSNTCPFDTFLVGLKLRYLKPHSMMSVCFIVCCNINSSDRCCCKIPSHSWTGITKCATKYWYQSFYLQKPWPFWIGVWVSSENRESDWSSAEVVYREWKVWLCLKMCITLNRLPFW